MSEAARAEFLALMRAMEAEPVHVAHVTRLALQIFDGLAALHGLGERERLLLEAASSLHDIGHQFDHLGTGHHKESARLIREHPWKNFNPLDVSIIALVARYHRKSVPELKQGEFAALELGDRIVVQKLAALLRLADALDRNHAQYVARVTPEVQPNRIVLHLEPSGPVLIEVIFARKKGDLAEKVFQRDLVFMVGGLEIKPEGPR